jgi:hypothetical protein
MSAILNERSLEQELVDCREELEHLEASASDTVLVERLRREKPLHPTLLVWRFMMSVAWLMTTLTMATLVVPLLSSPIAQQLAELETLAGFSVPVLLAVHAVSALMIALGARQLASLRGISSPPLPHERSKRSQLFGDIVRLRTVMEVRKRTARTATPAPATQRSG